MDDSGIVALFWKRDERAIAEFERSYKNMCMGIARSVTGSEETAKECCNDACLRLWNAIPPEKPRSLRAYAGRIIRNLALNRLETEKAQKRPAILCELDECVEGELQDVGSGELSAVLDDFLASLPPLRAKLFVRRYFYSEPVKDIAARLSINENKASKLLAKTRAELKKFLEERGISVK